MSPATNEPHDHDHLFECEAALFIAHIEADLRTSSLDLWIAGWTPDELLDHVRRSVADHRAGDLLSLVLLVDDSLRSDQSRPPDWRASINRLRAVTGTTIDDLRPGWIARWIRANSTYATSRQVAELLYDVGTTLNDLVCPRLEATRCPPDFPD